MTTASIFLRDDIETPIGRLAIVADGEGRLRAVDWTDCEERLARLLARHYGARSDDLRPARDPGGFSTALAGYFAGDLGGIEGLPTETNGTPFQKRVWAELRRIPSGTTITYAELARRIGAPSAVRAVGLANGANPIGIVVPCHRVVGTNGTLTGYAGGIPRKQWLLAHEGWRAEADSSYRSNG